MDSLSLILVFDYIQITENLKMQEITRRINDE